MTEENPNNILILGSGPAGLTAAIYAARAGLNPVVLEGMQPGGQLTLTTDVENFPGFATAVQGPDLMAAMRTQAEHMGTQIITDHIHQVELSSELFVAQGSQRYETRSLIIATGARARWLGLESEERYRGYGVSACATCDGFFFRDRKVAVVGGGNAAVEEALYLTRFASHVTVIHRRDSLRADRINQKRLLENPKISMCWNSEVDEVLGADQQVTGVRLRKTTGGTEMLEIDGLFVAIGHVPETELFKGQLDMDQDGYLITRPDSTATNVPGVFAAGDVKDRLFRQAVTAAGMGCMAALEAERFLLED